MKIVRDIDPLQLPGKLPAGKQPFWNNNPQALRQLAEGLVFASLVLLLFLMVAPVYLRTTEMARRKSCRNNLHNLALALEMYAQDHEGRMPPYGGDLTRQLLTYLPEGRGLVCPSDRLARPRSLKEGSVRAPISYSYLPPYMTNAWFQGEYTRTPLAWDIDGGIRTGAHRVGGNVVYLDGHTRFLSSTFWSAADRPF